jgi:hypothetical protein
MMFPSFRAKQSAHRAEYISRYDRLRPARGNPPLFVVGYEEGESII